MTSDTPDTKIALMGLNIENIKTDVKDIKAAIRDLSGVYITKSEFDDAQKAFNLRMTRLEEKSNLWKWLSPTLSAVVVAILEYLLIYYLQHLK